MLQSYPEAKVQLVSFFFSFFFSSYKNHIVWTFPCADFKPRAEPACLCDELDILSSVWETNASFAEQSPCTLPKQKQVFHHNVKSQGIVCSRRKGSKLQQTIMKGHDTQSGSASQLPEMLPLPPPPPHLSPFILMSPLNRTPLVLITTSSSDGKSIRNHHWDRSPLSSLCAALTSFLSLFHNRLCE